MMKLNKNSSDNTDKIFVNGVIYSINGKCSVYESMAIKDGSIMALGSNEEVSNYATDKTEIVDLKFRIVLPGFIDAHCHISERMMIKKDGLSLYDASNPWQYLKLIQSYVDSHPEEKIIYGVGWKSSNFEGAENDSNRYTEVFKGPHKKWLEKIKTDKPIVLKDCDSHALWLNNEAFEYFKITKHTKVPVGGKIELDEQGELWGTLKENATRLVNIDNAKNYKDKEYLSRFIKHQNILHSYGITTIGLIGEEKLEMPLELYRRLEITNKFKLRVSYGVTIMPYDVCKRTICEQIHQLKRNRILYKTDLFDISIAKFFADGIIEMETAYLVKPYGIIDKKSIKTNGIFRWDMLEFKEAIKMANRLDFNVCIHAVGDLACKLAIDGIEYSANNNIRNSYRNSLTPIDLISKYYIRRMKLLNINAIIQPFWFYKNVNSSKNEVLAIGEERAHREYPVKSLIDEGIVTAGSSDHEVPEEPNPLNAIECAIIRNLYDFIPSKYPERVDMNDTRYRLNPSERISALEAVKAFTIDAAYVLGKEKEVGSLEIGKKADFIILDKNIFTTEPLEIHDINVERTYFNGELVYLNE
ncbi:MAG: amidohydrolase [Clostridium sp.]|uniref:amidohydrolase n=1 Tax=Clostridium sp. TaxID=1506 RepID=UPI0025B80DBB|nr:amidohydrolase [Clostridium sp.]MCE5220516.1 amidohydrolase [Clostridium sp.]